MIRVLNEAGIAQPEYAVLAVIEFRSVMIMGVEGMQGRVPVRQRLRVAGVRLVEMLLRQGRRDDQPGRQGESDDGAAEPGWHKRDYGLESPEIIIDDCIEHVTDSFADRLRSLAVIDGARHRCGRCRCCHERQASCFNL